MKPPLTVPTSIGLPRLDQFAPDIRRAVIDLVKGRAPDKEALRQWVAVTEIFCGDTPLHDSLRAQLAEALNEGLLPPSSREKSERKRQSRISQATLMADVFRVRVEQLKAAGVSRASEVALEEIAIAYGRGKKDPVGALKRAMTRANAERRKK